MKFRIINTGKAIAEAEEKLNKCVAEMGDVEIKLLSDSGMRVIIGYEEKKVLTKPKNSDKIKGIKGTAGESDEDKNLTDNKRRRKPVRKANGGE